MRTTYWRTGDQVEPRYPSRGRGRGTGRVIRVQLFGGYSTWQWVTVRWEKRITRLRGENLVASIGGK